MKEVGEEGLREPPPGGLWPRKGSSGPSGNYRAKAGPRAPHVSQGQACLSDPADVAVHPAPRPAVSGRGRSGATSQVRGPKANKSTETEPQGRSSYLLSFILT